MDGHHHRWFAAAAWPAIAVTAHAPHWQVAAGVPVAVLFANLCDWDNTPAWKRLDRWLPDEVLGDGGPLGHRQLWHWWGIPVALGLLAHQLPMGVVGWAVWAALAGWLSHVVLDWPFGKEGPGHQRGVPVFLWYGRMGGWLYADRVAANLLIWPICALLLWDAAGWPGAALVVPWMH